MMNLFIFVGFVLPIVCAEPPRGRPLPGHEREFDKRRSPFGFDEKSDDAGRYFLRCPNEQLRDMGGRIRSPGYPGRLPINTCFQWSIFIKSGNTLTLSFRDFKFSDMVPGKPCRQGFLEVGPVPSRQMCLDEAGTDAPTIYTSTHSLVWIKMVTGPFVSQKGFLLEYFIGPVPSSVCGPGLRQCGDGKCLPFDWFCNGHSECADNRDETDCDKQPGNVTPRPSLREEGCGPGRFLCISRLENEEECFMDYQRCDGVVNCVNAEDERKCDTRRLHCGGYTEAPSGYITSPNYPQPYPDGKTCVWNIHVPAGRVIQIRFRSFELSPQSPVSSSTDFIEFRDGRGRRSKLLGRYTEQHRPPSLIETTGDWLYVKFYAETGLSKDALGFNFTHQIKGVCLAGQERCRDERDCFVSRSEKCDGIWHCRKHGWDERGCANCDYDKFSCGSGGRCYTEQEHCNGRGSCFDNRDEKNCTPEQCNSGNGTYLCVNGRCIYESWVCDGTNDCDDDSDEKGCVAKPSIRVILAAVVGSLICGLLLVIALGCTLHMFAIRIHDHTGHYETPMSRLQAELMRRAAPPTYNEAMQTSIPFTEMLNQMRNAGRRLSRSSRRDNVPNPPLNVAPLLANPGTRITNPEPGSDTTANADSTGAGTQLPVCTEANNMDNDNDRETSLCEETARESLSSSDSDVSLLELSSNTDSSSSTASSIIDPPLDIPHQSETIIVDDQAPLLANESTTNNNNEIQA